MGNSNSLHTINWDSSAGGFANGSSKSELNGCYQKPSRHHGTLQDSDTQAHSLLRRQNNQSLQRTDRTRPYPAVVPAEQFKVLPKISVDRPKLRPTSNGMLLHAGGTISGRHKDDMRAPGLMQRSRTLIFDGDDGSKSREKAEQPSFQRSQTLLHLSYKDRGKDGQETNKNLPPFRKGESSNQQSGLVNHNLRNARSEPDFRNDLNKPTHARKTGLMDSANVVASTATTSKTTATTITTKLTATTSTTTKLNKYNKKRKAPPAPAAVKSNHSAERAMENAENVVTEKAAVTRRFRTNVSNKQHQQQQHQQQQKQQTKPEPSSSAPTTQPIFRREKSCDAILLRSKNEIKETAANEKRFSVGNKIDESNRQEPKSTTNAPKQASKIPQLKRTFYFGMQAGAEAEAAAKQPPAEIAKRKETAQQKGKERTNDQTAELSPHPYRLTHAAERTPQTDDNVVKAEESEVNDNGILVHIRPALPRRQLDVPSFSPAAAWRMLTLAEEEKLRQAQRSSSNGLNCESPIQLKSNKLVLEMEELRREQPALVRKELPKKDTMHTIAWTPQQDLGDDDDDDVNNGIQNDTSSSDDFDAGAKDEEDGLLFFNGSTKKGKNSAEIAKEKGSSLGVHMFSLSLPRETHLDAHLQKRNFIMSNANDRVNGFSSLQKLKLSISGGNRCACRSSESQTQQEFCEIHCCQSMMRSDNWVLHKTGVKEGASNTLTGNSGKLLKSDISPTMEPISLSYLTGGKHKMYLPGVTKTSTGDESDERTRKETTPTQADNLRIASRQRQRKKETRESLQDEVPVLPREPSSQASPQQMQRFSFQSTVRLLEKRRLAEKLSRSAEIREAQRKTELEAMKRVEEDFQRKRASEKANIRHQLRLISSSTAAFDENATSNNREQYNSLPALMGLTRQRHDTNNNKISVRRAEPDGAAASPSPTFLLDTDPHRFTHEISHLPLKRKDSDGVDSDMDDPNSDLTHFNRTASMVEPYLQSFMK